MIASVICSCDLVFGIAWSETDQCSKPYMVQRRVKTDDAKPEATFTNTLVTHL